ncbi:MAG: peptidyl-prolyl cis-trans isomerase [Sandaracinaceae bacterium]|nr:peptidyl-prolyl cis-trans isomerase [Sandaracinaceae bacterium]
MATESKLRAVVREPLLHFAVIAAAVFAADRAFGVEAPAAQDPYAQIVVDDAFVDGLVEQERLAAGSAPARDEALARWAREERLAREAVRLGLGAHDPILRRRLVQLAELWLEASVALDEPSDETLAFVLERDATRYAIPDARAIEHVYFARRRADPAADAEGARAALDDGAPVAALGDPFLLGARFPLRTRAELAGSFGEAFAAAVFALEGEGFSAPIESSYGVHLVRVTERRAARRPALDEVRARVRADWREEQTRAHVRAAEDALRARYEVVWR